MTGCTKLARTRPGSPSSLAEVEKPSFVRLVCLSLGVTVILSFLNHNSALEGRIRFESEQIRTGENVLQTR